MPLCLPKSGLDIRAVPVASGDVNLIEWHIDGSALSFHLGLPVHFERGVEIFTNGIVACVPKPHPFDQVVAERVI